MACLLCLNHWQHNSRPSAPPLPPSRKHWAVCIYHTECVYAIKWNKHHVVLLTDGTICDVSVSEHNDGGSGCSAKQQQVKMKLNQTQLALRFYQLLLQPWQRVSSSVWRLWCRGRAVDCWFEDCKFDSSSAYPCVKVSLVKTIYSQWEQGTLSPPPTFQIGSTRLEEVVFEA